MDFWVRCTNVHFLQDQQQQQTTMTLTRHYRITLQSDDGMAKGGVEAAFASSSNAQQASLVSLRRTNSDLSESVSPPSRGGVRSMPIRVSGSSSSSSLSSSSLNDNDDDNESINTRASSASSSTIKILHPSPASPPRAGGVASSSSASHIRSRFLHKLGIDHNKNVVSYSTNISSHHHRVRPRPSQQSDYSFQESLKADYGLPAASVDSDSDCGSTISASTSSSASTCKMGAENCKKRKDVEQDNRNFSSTTVRSVSFDTAVRVHPIPLRSQYSNRIRNSLWTPVSELQENAARNCVEFAAENWDWRQAAEDDDMVVYHGEKIHPIHFLIENDGRQQQEQPPPLLLLQEAAGTAAAPSMQQQPEPEFSLRRMLFSVLSAQKEEA